jgi:hypothetical protein
MDYKIGKITKVIIDCAEVKRYDYRNDINLYPNVFGERGAIRHQRWVLQFNEQLKAGLKLLRVYQWVFVNDEKYGQIDGIVLVDKCKTFEVKFNEIPQCGSEVWISGEYNS